MLPLQFFGQNLHFALNLFFSLVAFATFWLYFDAWLVSKKVREVFKWFGFLLLSVSFIFQAIVVEEQVLGDSLFGGYSQVISITVRLLAYLTLIYALAIDPLQKVPDNKGIAPANNIPAGGFLGVSGFSFSLKILLPFGPLAIALLYLRKATIGLERHLKAVSLAFFLLTLYEILGLASLFRESTNINIYNLTSAFGPLWIFEQILLLLTTLVLGRWVWSYLVKRLQSQLFMIFTSSVLIIFLIVSISFTFLLVRNIQEETLQNLETAAKVLNYSLESKKSEIAATAEVFSENPEIKDAVAKKDHDQIITLLETSLGTKRTNSILITNETGLVLARAEEPDNWGDSISSDPLVKRAIGGQEATNFVTKEGVSAPVIYLQSARPIIVNNKVIGSVLVSLTISNSFLDGIKSSTGLESAVYSNNVRSATTLVTTDKKERWVGVKEENEAVKKTVLNEGETFKGSLPILNKQFLAVYQPIKNVNNETIGMSLTGQPQVLILRASGKSIELTFLIAVALLVISIVPAYLISKYISNQIR